MNLVGKGFRLTPEEVQSLGYTLDALPRRHQKPHRNARDMMQGGEDCFVIDLFGLTAEQARETITRRCINGCLIASNPSATTITANLGEELVDFRRAGGRLRHSHGAI